MCDPLNESYAKQLKFLSCRHMSHLKKWDTVNNKRASFLDSVHF